MVEIMKDKVVLKSKAYAAFFEMMGDSFVNESEYLKFHWDFIGVQGVIPVVPHIPIHVPQFPG